MKVLTVYCYGGDEMRWGLRGRLEVLERWLGGRGQAYINSDAYLEWGQIEKEFLDQGNFHGRFISEEKKKYGELFVA